MTGDRDGVGRGRAHHQRIGLGRFDLVEDRGEVSGPYREHLVDDDLEALLFRGLHCALGDGRPREGADDGDRL